MVGWKNSIFFLQYNILCKLTAVLKVYHYIRLFTNKSKQQSVITEALQKSIDFLGQFMTKFWFLSVKRFYSNRKLKCSEDAWKNLPQAILWFCFWAHIGDVSLVCSLHVVFRSYTGTWWDRHEGPASNSSLNKFHICEHHGRIIEAEKWRESMLFLKWERQSFSWEIIAGVRYRETEPHAVKASCLLNAVNRAQIHGHTHTHTYMAPHTYICTYPIMWSSKLARQGVELDRQTHLTPDTIINNSVSDRFNWSSRSREKNCCKCSDNKDRHKMERIEKPIF